MIKENKALLSNCSGQVNVEGNPVKAIGYYSDSTNKRINTISIYTIGFTGRIYVYGTTKIEPEEADWVVIPLTETTDYIEFNHLEDLKNVRDNRYVNVVGSFTWLKAKLDRTYLDVVQTPVPINYNITTGTYAPNVGDHIPMGDRVIQVTPPAGPDLVRCGNVECVMLTY